MCCGSGTRLNCRQFVRNRPDWPCLLPHSPPVYVESDGYRLTPGNECTNGVQRGGVTKPCPPSVTASTVSPLPTSAPVAPTTSVGNVATSRPDTTTGIAPTPTRPLGPTPSPAGCLEAQDVCTHSIDCCGTMHCIAFQCAECPTGGGCQSEAVRARCTVEDRVDQWGCVIQPTCAECNAAMVPDASVSPGGLGAGIIFLIVALVLLCLLLLAVLICMAVKRKRNSCAFWRSRSAHLLLTLTQTRCMASASQTKHQ